MFFGSAGIALCVTGFVLSLLGVEFWAAFTCVGLLFTVLGMLEDV